MKKVKAIFILVWFVFLNTFFVIDNNIANKVNNINNVPLAVEYSENADFDINKLPERMFYKLNYDCKYILNADDVLTIKLNENRISYITYNDFILNLFDDVGDWGAKLEASAYLIRDNGIHYLLIDKMASNDVKYYQIYGLINNKIESVEEECGRIDFVGYDYIIGYTDLGMIGYQRCEFKKVFKNGKLELDGEYKVTKVKGETSYPFWQYYTLTKDLKYVEFDNSTQRYSEKILKAGTKIRSTSTDAKSYIEIETEDKRRGKIKVDKVEEIDRVFFVNGQLFMNYYFLDGSKYGYEVFRTVFAY